MLKLPDLSALMPARDGLSRPDWDAIEACINKAIPEKYRNDAWAQAARQWLELVAGQLDGDYICEESQNFIVLTESSKRLARDVCKFYEKALKTIIKYLPGVASDDGYGKHVVMMFTKEDDYYRYIMYFYPDGEHPMSGGVCLSGDGYTHYAFPLNETDPSGYRGTLVHELTHGCLEHLEIPTWLNEAIAMRMEHALCGSSPLDLDREQYRRHKEYWNAATIQQFWAGSSWSIVEDGFELSYSLAKIIWRKFEKDLRAPQSAILEFIATANHADAGEGACRRLFDLSLGDFVADFLGEGPWAPDPERYLMEYEGGKDVERVPE
ncbi:MAG: hypothetical protein H7A51_19770 [Akkermansiaceae bacterium]|nr:hypothetical protein [Akkermansiaceae bacterium]